MCISTNLLNINLILRILKFWPANYVRYFWNEKEENLPMYTCTRERKYRVMPLDWSTSVCLPVADEAASPRALAIASGVAQLPAEHDRVPVEDGGGVVPRQRPGRGTVLLREAPAASTAPSAPSGHSAFAANIADRSGPRWRTRQGRRGRRQDRGYPRRRAGSRGDQFRRSGRVGSAPL